MDNYKAGSRKTGQINFLPKYNLYKVGTGTKQFSRKKTYIFFEKLLFTMLHFPVYILNNFFHSVFCPLNCFGWSKKFEIYRNYESVTSTMIRTFSNYSTFYCTFRKCLKVLLEFFGISPPVFPSWLIHSTCISH